MILTFMEEGARAVISFCIRSEIPGYMDVDVRKDLYGNIVMVRKKPPELMLRKDPH
jgi:hypothetical protein